MPSDGFIRVYAYIKNDFVEGKELFYRQVTTATALEALPLETVLYFDGLAAVKNSSGEWLIAGERSPVSSKVLHSMSDAFHVVSEYSFFPKTGYNSGRVNLTNILQLVSKYGEMPWVIVFEWTRDFFGVSLDTARNAVWELVKTGRLEIAENDNLRVARSR